MLNHAGAVPEEGARSGGVLPSRVTEEQVRPGRARACGGGAGERGEGNVSCRRMLVSLYFCFTIEMYYLAQSDCGIGGPQVWGVQWHDLAV